MVATTFAVMPEWLLDSSISDGALRLYLLLGRYANKRRKAWPGERTMAARMGRGERTVRAWLAELRTIGAISVQPRYRPSDGRRTSNLYTLHFDEPAGQNHRHVIAGGEAESEALNRQDSAAGQARATGSSAPDKNESQKELEPEPDVLPPPPSTAKVDVIWDAVMFACGIDATAITKSARGAYNRAVSDLKAIGALPDAIVDKAARFRRLWPDVSLTPTALVRRWAEVDQVDAPAPARLSKSQTNIDNAFERIARGTGPQSPDHQGDRRDLAPGDHRGPSRSVG